MMTTEEQVAIAKQIEAAKLANLIEEAKTCDLEIAQAIAKAAATGQLGGRLELHCVTLRLDALRSIIDGMLAERRRLIQDVSMLADKNELTEFRIKLEGLADSGMAEIMSRESKPPKGLASYVADEIRKTVTEIKEKIRRDLTIIEGDAQLTRVSSPPGIIHINAGAGSIISVGNTANNIVSTLNQIRGDSELSQVLGQLTEAIQRSNLLAQEDKTRALESLEFIVGQVTLEPERRAKLTVIEGVWNRLVQTVGFAANLAQLVSTAAPLLMQHLIR